MRFCVITPVGLKKGVDNFLGGRGGGKVRRIGLGKHGRTRRSGRRGLRDLRLLGAEGCCRRGRRLRKPVQARAAHVPGPWSEVRAQTRQSARRRRGNGWTDESSFSPSIAGKLPSNSSLIPGLRLHLNFDGDGKSAAHAKRLGGDLQDRSGLLALVLRALNQAHHLLDEFERKTVLRGDALRRLIALHVGFEMGSSTS